MARRRRLGWRNSLNLPSEERIPCEPELLWKARHSGVPLFDKVVKVKCLGKIHKIRFRFPGYVTLLDHPDKRGEATMMKLGGDKPECLTILEHWRAGENEAGRIAYSRPIIQQVLQARLDWRRGKAANQSKYNDWLLLNLKERLLERIERIYSHLRHKVQNQFMSNDERNYLGRYGSKEPDREKIMRPIIGLRFQDLINKPTEEVSDEESN